VIVDGLLLAAGAGTRMGRPKALVVGDDGTPWLVAALGRLHDGGCRRVTVVLGAAAAEAATLIEGAGAQVVVAADWAEGMSASLRTGLAALDPDADAALVTLVDLPDVTADVIGRGPHRARRPRPRGVRRHARPPGADRPRPLGRRHRDGDRRPGRTRLPEAARGRAGRVR
jgi:CTP:molybdopterin cytidylyltransferase MocA